MNYHQLAFQFLSVRRDYIKAARLEVILGKTDCWKPDDWYYKRRQWAVLNAVRYIIKYALDDEGKAALAVNIRQIMAIRKRAGLKD